MKNPQKLDSILNPLLQQYDLEQGIEHHRIAAMWPAIVGEPMRYYTKVLRASDQRLHVAVKEQRFLYPLSLLKPKLLQAVNQQGLEIFRDITFSYSNRVAFEPAPESGPTRRPLNLEEQQWCEEMARQLEGELADIFRRVVEKDISSRP